MARLTPSHLLLLGAILAALAWTSAAHYEVDPDHLCGAPEVPDPIAERVHNMMMSFQKRVCTRLDHPETVRICAQDKRAFAPIEIPLIWNILYDPETGDGSVNDTIIDLQTEILNIDFAGENENGPGGSHHTGFSFVTKAVNRIANANWFHNMILLEQIFKPQLANDTAHNLHMYVGEMNGGVLGMCYFAFMYAPDSHMHGCLIHHTSMVHGGQENYDNGQTCTHEIGHHIGLYHVWQGNCRDISDRVDDTPPQASNSRGCPDPIPQSCEPGLFDNIHNFMDYSDDVCRYEFTKGQTERADLVISTFHPGYLPEAERAAILRAVPNAWDEVAAFQIELGQHFQRNGLKF